MFYLLGHLQNNFVKYNEPFYDKLQKVFRNFNQRRKALIKEISLSFNIMTQIQSISLYNAHITYKTNLNTHLVINETKKNIANVC